MSYEIHITIDIENLSKAEKRKLRQEIPYDDWQISHITDDPIMGPGARYYLNNHTNSLNYAQEIMEKMWDKLIDEGFKPCRKKIEHIVYDFINV